MPSQKRNKSKFVILGVLAAGVSLGALQAPARTDVRIIQAARASNTAEVRTLIRQRVDVNAAEGDGSTALLWAAYRGNAEIAQALVAAGANVNVANRLKMTPLLQASRMGDGPMVELLLKAGANARTIYAEGETALMAASGSGSLQAVRLLLAAGVDVNQRDTVQQQTALMWAADGGHAPVVQALLEAGADVNALAKPSSLSRARGDGGRMWVDWSSGGLTAMMFAARQGQLDAIRVLADRRAEVRLANPDGITAMLLAVLNDRVDAAALLLEKGANPNDGSLLEAVRLHNIRTNETAGEATRPRPAHANQLTPVELIRRLVDAGADPYRAAAHTLHLDGTGQPAAVNQTAMAAALGSQDVASVRALLSKGANPNAAGADGATPLLSAAGGGAGGGRGGFAGGFGATPAGFRFQSERNALEVVKVLIGAGADVNAARPTGDTALHAAAQSGNVALIQVLADSGARLDVQNKAGLTPLDLAMGRQPPPGANPAPGAAPGGGRGGGQGGGGGGAPGGAGGRGGGPQPQPQAIALLRQLMGLPAEAPAAPPVPNGQGNQ